MLQQSWQRWIQTIRQPGTWTVAIWSLAFGLIMFLTVAVLGGGAIFLHALHPFSSLTSGATPHPNPVQSVKNLIAMYVVILGIGPFFTGGAYGVLAAAVTGEPIYWRTFWEMGRRNYGRAWGLILYGIIYTIILLIVLFILIASLHVVGGVIGAIFVFLSLPWVLRMFGGLFMENLSWGKSFKASFRGPSYAWLLLALVLVAIGYGVLFALLALIMHFIAAIGIGLYVVAEMALSVIVPVWLFAFYYTEQHQSNFLGPR